MNATDFSMAVVLQPLGLFGQIVIGPPGSGKSTYCTAMQEFLVQLGRSAAVVNLDPANDTLPYTCAVDLKDLIHLDEVMQALNLGPNGGLIYCMEYLYTNRNWLMDKLTVLKANASKTYLIFDCPGQVELYCNNGAFRKLLTFLTHNPPTSFSTNLSSTKMLQSLQSAGEDLSAPLPSGLGLRLTSVHLVDSHYCSEAGKFISVLLTSMVAMLQLGLPHVNVLSKVDLVEQYGPLPFNLDYFTEVLNLEYLVEQSENHPFYKKYKRLNHVLAELIQNNSLLSFQVLDVQDKVLLGRVMQSIDKANGYVFGNEEQRSLQSMLSCAAGVDFSNDYVCMVQEKYIGKMNMKK